LSPTATACHETSRPDGLRDVEIVTGYVTDSQRHHRLRPLVTQPLVCVTNRRRPGFSGQGDKYRDQEDDIYQGT